MRCPSAAALSNPGVQVQQRSAMQEPPHVAITAQVDALLHVVAAVQAQAPTNVLRCQWPVRRIACSSCKHQTNNQCLNALAFTRLAAHLTPSAYSWVQTIQCPQPRLLTRLHTSFEDKMCLVLAFPVSLFPCQRWHSDNNTGRDGAFR